MEASDLYSFLSDPELVELIEQVKISDDILDVINLNENQHSDMLAWCLSPNEGHAQADAVIKDFLIAAYAARDGATYDNKRFFAKWTPGRIRTSSFGAAFVAREFAVKVEDGARNGRLDLFLVDPQNRIIVAIENKTGAKLNEAQLSKYHAAVKAQITRLPVFSDYDFSFVVLDRYLDKYDDEYRWRMGTKWVLLDYSWLRDSAKRARLQVARNNQAAQLLVAYCQQQTDWESPVEQRLSGLAVELSMRHEPVVKALRELRRQKFTDWIPSKLQGQCGELILFKNQHRQLCTHLLSAQGIAAVLFQIRQGLSNLKLEYFETGRSWLQFASPEIEQLAYQGDEGVMWPILVNVYREVNDGDADNSKYTVRLIWCKENFNDAIGGPDVIRKHFQSLFPALKKFDGSNVRRIVIGRHLDASSAAKEAIKLSTTIKGLISSQSIGYTV